MIWIGYIVDAISLGSLDALIALGLALLFGLMGLVNFAHGELIMVGAYMLFLMIMGLSLPFAVAIPIMLIGVIGLALAMERIAFRPVRSANPMTLLITSFALSYLLQNLSTSIFGARAKSLLLPNFFVQGFSIGTVTISYLSILTVVLTVVLLAALALFMRRTPAGIQMLAAAADFQMARLVGVRANRVIATAFAISGLLAGVATIILVAQAGVLSPDMGVQPVLVAFAAIIIGGIGTLTGAVAGGFALGFTTIMLQALLPPGLEPFRDAFLFGIVIIFLLVRPQGLMPSAATRERT